MGNKWIALGIVGAAAWLFKTKKGAEVRKQIGKTAGDWGQKVREQYAAKSGAAKSQTA